MRFWASNCVTTFVNNIKCILNDIWEQIFILSKASYDPSSTLTWHNSDLYSPSGKNDRAHSSIVLDCVLDCVRLLSDQLRVIGGHRQSLDHKINANE